jgi:guanylate kinase
MSNEAVPPAHASEIDHALLVVISAPSGTGKTTLAHRLIAETPGSIFSVSCTTRAQRRGERDGIDYQFLSTERFSEMIQEDAFAEWAPVLDHFYGTPRATVEMALKEGRLALFDIDVQGGEQLKARYPQTVTVFVMPPSRAELARRLRLRGTESEEQFQKRLLSAESEIRRARGYDYLLYNDDLEKALSDLRAIVRAEGLRTRRFKAGLPAF